MRRSLLFLAPLVALACATASDPESAPSGSVDGGPSTTTPDAGAVDGEAPDASNPAAPVFTVLSLNLHCLKLDGTAFTAHDPRFRAIAKAAADERVDAILAQEVCKNATLDARVALEGALAEATGARWSSAAAFAHRAWEGTPDAADEHVAIFARGELGAPRTTTHRAQGSLVRVTLGATASSALGATRLYTVHLDHADAVARAAQGREVAALAMNESDEEKVGSDGALPIVVAGDFNARIDAMAPVAMTAFGFVEASGSKGTTRIDHVFVHRGAPFAPSAAIEMFTGASAVSDHPGVLVRFAKAAPKPVKLTRIVARGTTANVTVRGDRAPFDWERGWPAFPRRNAEATLVTSELPAGAFTYKFLRDDKDWALGENVAGQGERDNASTPSFP